MKFREFLDQKEKPWEAKKDEILASWKTIRPDLPINPEPVPKGHHGSRYDVDGIRITGSAPYINSVLSRIKDMIQFETSPGTKLDLKYRQVVTKQGDPQAIGKYVCYVHVVER